ncbi:MAG: hypothetical protein CVT49_08805 [candidate division Zixibacteria bacterium HGW-Zixibacteria-1]|nr:MAG: hypothetical protein CVT49_08805 [candidate division Zixibacteria bacterium HGW-Zixibacteria-1]
MSIDKNHPDYINLRKRIRENSKDFIAIIGAGLSRPAGLPSWDELRNLLINDAFARLSEYPEDEQDGYKKKLASLRSYNDLWKCFQELKKLLPGQAYISAIKSKLEILDKSRIPETYDMLWRLKIKGIVTFNIDTCAIDSFARENKCHVDMATSLETHKYSQFLSGTHNFVFHPHGILMDPTSWVFTEGEKTQLLCKREYISFMSNLCQTKNLLILGYNLEDFAFKYIIQHALITSHSTEAKHFILLPNPNRFDIEDLGNKSIAVIPYKPDDPEKHTEIGQFLNDCLSYIPKDTIPSSVFTGEERSLGDLPNDDELINMSINDARWLLNSAIRNIIPPDRQATLEDIDKLEYFYNDHLKAIHMAWLVSKNSNYDTLYGYKIIDEIGSGAFGQVYEVENINTKERAAIKILHLNVRDKKDYLNSFRRGVYSMRILTEKKVLRMVKIIEAYEVPACILMEYIDGLTLSKAKEYKFLESLETCLEVLLQIGDVVYRAHSLDEIVLHRDLKPDNVILKDFYNINNDIDVIVLDFDLSWHKGASDLSVVHGARAQGYAAPEQTASGRQMGISTRNTAVDVFGYGMLAYFVFVGDDPRPNAQKFSDFSDNVRKTIIKKYAYKWHCLPDYLTGIIIGCTKDNQNERISFSEAKDAFQAAYDMASSDKIRHSDPLLLREVACRIDPDGQFSISDFDRELSIRSGDGSKTIILKLISIENKPYVYTKLTKIKSAGDHRYAGKYINRTRDKAVSMLNVHPFVNPNGIIGQSLLEIEAYWPLDDFISLELIDKVTERIIAARAEMQFE